MLREHLVRGYTVNERRLAELRKTVRLVEAGLVAVTLMIAESRPAERETLCRIVEHLLE